MPRPPSRPSPSRRRAGPRPAPPAPPRRAGRLAALRRHPRALLAGSAAAFALALAVGAWNNARSRDAGRPARLLAAANAATAAGDRARALAAWHAWNEGDGRTAASLLVEAHLAADLGRGSDADALARRSLALDSASAAAWSLRINRLRVLDRVAEALRVGRAALDRLPAPDDRRAILRATTLAALAEVPDAEARAQLDRWAAADPADVDARVARLARVANEPRPGDPDRAARIAALQALLDRDPGHVPAREALVVALADAGEVDRGRAALDAWPSESPGPADPLDPAPARDDDPRYRRLRARWDLDYDRRPDRAAAGFAVALAALPHDWKSHYGRARALRTLGRGAEAEVEARAVAAIRERLDPATLGPRLTADLARLDATDQPADVATAAADLAALCRGVGLVDLAAAWDRAAATAP